MKSVQFSVVILSQIEDLINQLSNELYSNTMDVLSSASIGQHVRHVLEFYYCIIEQKNSGNISYDTRKRDLALEVDRSKALQFIQVIKTGLSHLSEDKPLTLTSKLEETILQTPSSVSREMIYVLEHAVHHMAIIKIGFLIGCPHIQLPSNFGVADSTIQYRKQCAQ